MTPIPWLLVAVPHERRAFARRTLETLRRRPTFAWRCQLDGREFLLAETGVGGAMVEATLDWLASISTPTFVFVAGFAGALTDDLHVGDAIRADAVVDPTGVRRAAASTDLPYRVGTLLTSDKLVGAPDDKRRLATLHRAVAVDMESSYVARWCEQRRIEWACVRVVSDDVHTPVSKDVFDLLENGRVSPWRLTKAIARRPAIVRELLSLQRATKKAAAVVAAALHQSLAASGGRKAPESRNPSAHL